MKCRSFNSVTLAILKRPLSDYGRRLQHHEQHFYIHIHGKDIEEYFPTVYNLSPLTIEYLEGYGHFSGPNIDPVLQRLEKIHAHDVTPVSLDEFRDQVRIETVNKIQARRCSVPEFTHVNGLRVITLDEAVERFSRRLDEYVPKRQAFCLIHGDLNFGNILVKGDDIKFIDPRGYFGELENIGPAEYDTAKLYFSLSGYDAFYERKDFTYTCDGDSITFDIQPVDDSRFRRDDFVTALMVTIWLGAPRYLETEPQKMIASYYYALYLATKYL